MNIIIFMYEVGIFSLLIWRLLSRRSSTVSTEYSGGAEMFSMIEIKKSFQYFLTITAAVFHTAEQQILFLFLFFMIPTSCYNVFSPLGSSERAALHFQSTNNSRPEHLKAI